MDYTSYLASQGGASAGFSIDTGFGDLDPYAQAYGAGSYSYVPADVSNGSQAEQPYTATGNGTGVFMDTTTEKGIFGLLGQALNYAMVRDQQKMTAVYGPQVTGYPAGNTLSVQAQANSRMLTYLLIGAGIWLAVRK
jgi:hypothetical protein